MEQTRKAQQLAKELRTTSLSDMPELEIYALFDAAAEMIDALIEGSALADPTEDGVILGSKAASRAAALLAFPRSGTQRYRVLNVIAGVGEHGVTDERIQRLLGMSPNTQRPRRLELVKGGWIKDSGKVRKTVSGAYATVWVATERGKAELNA